MEKKGSERLLVVVLREREELPWKIGVCSMLTARWFSGYGYGNRNPLRSF